MNNRDHTIGSHSDDRGGDSDRRCDCEDVKKILFEYEYIPTQEEVRKHIQECESHHTQQAIYSTFHDALTQICYGCLKVRTTIFRETSHDL